MYWDLRSPRVNKADGMIFTKDQIPFAISVKTLGYYARRFFMNGHLRGYLSSCFRHPPVFYASSFSRVHSHTAFLLLPFLEKSIGPLMANREASLSFWGITDLIGAAFFSRSLTTAFFLVVKLIFRGIRWRRSGEERSALWC